MQISQLSAETGVSIPTLKYYLREGLLPPGEATSTTRASYAASHVERVRLVRALVQAAGLSIADIRKVLAAVDDPPEARHELLGVAHHALPSPGLDAAVSDEVSDLVDKLGWQVRSDAPALRSLTALVAAARAAGVPLPGERLTAYAQASLGVAEVDLAGLETSDRLEDAVFRVTVGNVMVDPVLVALRRLAQEHLSAQSEVLSSSTTEAPTRNG